MLVLHMRNGKGHRRTMKALAGYHPAVLFFYFAAVLLTAMFVRHPVLLAESFVGAILLFAALESRKQFLSQLLFSVLLALAVTLTNPLFSHNGVTPLFFINGNPVTLEAVFYGAAIGCMTASVLLWCRCFQILFTGDKLMYLIGRPLPRVSLVFSLTLRFLPLFLQKRREISQAQKAMGLFGSGSISERAHSLFRTCSALFDWSLSYAMETAAAMKARGYGLAHRTNFHLYVWRRSDSIFLIFSGMTALFVAISFARGELRYAYYPAAQRFWEQPPLLAGAAFLLLVFLPSFLEIKESLKWKYYVSKI